MSTLQPPQDACVPGHAERSFQPTRMLGGVVAPLSGRGVLVTGAGRGIGRAIAHRLASLDATVLCVSRTRSELDETIEQAGARAFPLALDIAADGAAAAAVNALLAQASRLDILVHCAGIMPSGSVEETNAVELDHAFAINVRSPYVLTQAALPALKASQGQVVFVNSNVIRATNLTGRGVYAATQAALKALADSLRDELNGYGVRVLSIMPGATATARQEKIYAAAGLPYRPELLLQPQDVAEVACNALLLPRTAEATDLFVRPMQKISP
jgi:NAD(P)-dependent dehydrogenase (short-subunit alcohol dehydrogenase family)